MLDGEHCLAPAGRMEKPDLQLIWKWILESWEAISHATIVRSFFRCCISSSLDGTEDDILWQDDDVSDPFGTDEEAELVDEEGDSRKRISKYFWKQ